MTNATFMELQKVRAKATADESERLVKTHQAINRMLTGECDGNLPTGHRTQTSHVTHRFYPGGWRV